MAILYRFPGESVPRPVPHHNREVTELKSIEELLPRALLVSRTAFIEKYLGAGHVKMLRDDGVWAIAAIDSSDAGAVSATYELLLGK